MIDSHSRRWTNNNKMTPEGDGNAFIVTTIEMSIQIENSVVSIC